MAGKVLHDLLSQLLSFLPSYFTLQFCKSYSLCIGGLWRGFCRCSQSPQLNTLLRDNVLSYFKAQLWYCFPQQAFCVPEFLGRDWLSFPSWKLQLLYPLDNMAIWSVIFCAFEGRDSPSSLWAPHTHHGVKNPADDKYSSVNERRQHKWTGKLTATQKWHAFPFSSAVVTSFATLEGRRETGSGRLASGSVWVEDLLYWHGGFSTWWPQWWAASAPSCWLTSAEA